MPTAANWAAEMGRNWAARVDAMHAQLVPMAEIGVAALAPRPGERIFDLGCGGAATTAMIAERVGPEGQVTGLDISPELLAIARRACTGYPQVDFVEGDAQTMAFDGPPRDALFSRFGCMFFDDPPVAFANLRGGLRPGGRAVFVVYTDPSENPWADVPARAAAEVLGPPEPSPPGAPGPFGWSDPGIFEPILTAGGFSEIARVPHEVEVTMGIGDDPDPVVRAAQLCLVIGPVARRLKEAGEGAEEAVYKRLLDALRPHVRGGAVRLGARIWVITATA